MPTADLRALAAKVGLMKPRSDHVQPCPDWCGRSEGVLPTEAEARAAIFEAGYTWLELYICPEYVNVEFGEPTGSDVAGARLGESDDLVLLALLRALEEVRGG